MEVEVRLFAGLRERAGSGTVSLELPEGARVADALDALSDVVAGVPVVMAVNRRYANPETPISAGDELALVPPVSGGEADVHVRVTEDRLDPGALGRSVVRPSAGAVVTFQGVTREVPELDYEAYAEMAEAKIAEIAREVLAEHAAVAIAIEHRIGTVERGEPSVAVAASGPHREQAFAAARAAIDRVKAEAPIWKREEGRWVEGELPSPDG